MAQAIVTKKHFDNYETQMKNYSQLIGKAWGDPAFKKKLMENPEAVLRENGFDVPQGVKVQIHEDSPSVLNMSIPYQGSMELNDAQLDHVSGGGQSTSSSAATVVTCVSSVSTAC